MKCLRSVFVGVVVVACFGLTGFKKHIQNQETLTKRQGSQYGIRGESKQRKSLDLTVPSRNVSFEEAPEKLATGQGGQTDSLTIDSTGKPRVIDLNGHFIMSQEPEAGKMKSADGAGIMINLHH
jgi:hypothetical protein